MIVLRPWIAAAFSASVVLTIHLATAKSANSLDKAATDRSASLFSEMMPVLQSPRCMNCHTATNFPRQGDDEHRHIMLVVRGPDDYGLAALRCKACHQDANSPNSGVPGAPDWHLAPLAMAWEGLSAGALCRLFLDPRKSGIATEKMVEHMSTPLVQWAWKPGSDLNGHQRKPPTISSADFLKLTAEWVQTGAICPPA